MEPIWKEGRPEPHNTLVDRAIQNFQEDASICTIVEGTVVILRYSGVDHHDVVLLVLMKAGDKRTHLLEWEPLGVQGEYMAGVHAINAGPHSLQLNASDAVIIHNVGDIVTSR